MCTNKYARIPWAPFVNTAYLDEGKRPFAFLRSLTTGLQRNPKSTTGTAYLRLVNIGFQILGAASGTFVTASAAYLLYVDDSDRTCRLLYVSSASSHRI